MPNGLPPALQYIIEEFMRHAGPNWHFSNMHRYQRPVRVPLCYKRRQQLPLLLLPWPAAPSLTIITQRMPNARRAGPAPWRPLTALSGPTTLPIEFDTFPDPKHT